MLFNEMNSKLALGVHRTPMQRHIGPGDIASAWRTYKIIKELRPDVLHGHGAKGGAYARFFGSLLRVSRSRVARIYSPHGGSLHYDERTTTGKVFFAIERLMGRFTDQLLFVSDYERRAYRKKVGEPKVANSLVYNGLNASEFEPVIMSDDAADILYIGMMRDLKGPDILIEAIARARKILGRDIRAVMVGAGDDLPNYQRQVKQLGLQYQIQFLNPMPARKAFSLAHLVVVPSRAEAMPYIVLETLAAGRPMIATAVGGIPEIFGVGSAALVEPDPVWLGDRIVSALSDPTGYHSIMPTKRDLKARFGADVMASEIEKAYFTVLAR